MCLVGSVRLSVRQSLLSRLNRLTYEYDLEFQLMYLGVTTRGQPCCIVRILGECTLRL